MSTGNTKDVMHDRKVIVCDVTCAAPDNGNGKSISNAFCQLNRYTLQPPELRADSFERQCITQQDCRARALHSPPNIDGLRS
jgi:hypothetical protein